MSRTRPHPRTVPGWTGPAHGEGSAGSVRYLECLTHRVPHGLGLDSLGQSLVHGPAAHVAQGVVPGHSGRVGVTELRPHLVPEHREPHGARVPAPPRRDEPRRLVHAMAAWCAMGDPGPRPESGFPEAVTSARCRHIPAACGGVDKLSSAGFTICGWTPRGYRKRAGSGRAHKISKTCLSQE